ncbi:MAG: MBL fold metallo-hydrolase [Dehalococcoidia bacterium]|nr:MBL fold metallo-hydrolase [Dehalococcoidia bacterium]
MTEVAPGVRAMAAPGHTPGNLVVFLEAEGWLFSGDQLLPEITPTPAIQRFQSVPGAPWRFRSLPRFLDSLRRIRGLDATRCYPGHGDPFEDVAATIDANLTQAEQRTARVLEALRENSGATLYALAEGLYPRALRKRFWQIIATVQGHLDVLEEEGLATTAEGRWGAR